MSARAGIGHNCGPAFDPGLAWRRFAWAKARADLMPTLPVEVVRLRVKRAAELGLDYRTYASVRAATGRDVIGFLFSSNALRILKRNAVMPEDRAVRLSGIVAGKAAIANPPMPVAALERALSERGLVFESVSAAPALLASWSEARAAIDAARRAAGWPADAVLFVGDTHLERGWTEAGRLAGYIDSARYFGG